MMVSYFDLILDCEAKKLDGINLEIFKLFSENCACMTDSIRNGMEKNNTKQY